MKEAYISIENISKFFGEYEVISQVSLDIPEGSFTTLLGPSGCGKTTLLRIIAGFYEAEKGEIRINGQKVSGVPSYKRNTPLVFQEYALFPHLTVAQNITYGLKIKKIPAEGIKQKLREMIQIFGLENLEDRFPKQLSGGQQQRVAFARALIMGQKVLLLDEPLSNLDAKLRVEVRNELRAIQKRLGITAVYVTHDQDEALSMSDRVAVFDQGHLRQIGTPWEVYFYPKSRFVAEFVGTANFLQGEVMEVTPERILVRYQEFMIDLSNKSPVNPVQKGDRIILLLRPECIFLNRADSPEEDSQKTNQEENRLRSACQNASALNNLPGKIIDSSFLGRVIRYWVEVGGATLIVDDANPGYQGVIQGEVRLTFERERIHILPDDGGGNH